MRNRSTGYPDGEDDPFGLAVSKYDFAPDRDSYANSAEDVVGEIGLVLVVILGIVIALNVVLGTLHLV